MSTVSGVGVRILTVLKDLKEDDWQDLQKLVGKLGSGVDERDVVDEVESLRDRKLIDYTEYLGLQRFLIHINAKGRKYLDNL